MKFLHSVAQFITERRLILVALLCVIVFTAIGYRNLDPDFGWHYQLGKIITHTGIPKTDPFTFTMPSYPFVDYEWGSNVLMYVIYEHFGKLVLAFLFSVCAASAIVVLTSGKKSTEQFFLSVLGLATLIQYVGIRPQVISWLLLALLLRFLYDRKLWIKWRVLFPLLMLFWANVHGSYPIAFVLVGIFFAGETLQTRKINLRDALIVFAGALATIINPYGVNNWIEVIKQMAKTSLYRKTIGEWQPIYTHFVIAFWFLLTLLILLAWRYKTKIRWSLLLIAGCTTFMAITSVRHVSIFAISCIPILSITFDYLKKDLKKVPLGTKRFSQLMNILVLLALGILLEQLILTLHQPYGEENMFPKTAVTYLNNNVKAPLFNTYEWGGYLIWKLPDRKVFVDGRTPGFSWDAPSNESSDIYKEYLQVVAAKGNWQEILNKYGIEYAILQTKEFSYTEPSPVRKQLGDFYAKWLIGWGDDRYFNEVPLGITLQKEGWSIVYQDDIATVMKKP